MEKLSRAYNKSYKWLLIIPIAFLLYSVVYLYNFSAENGDIIYKDVSLTGGTTITLFDSKIDLGSLEKALETNFPGIHVRAISDLGTGEQRGVIVETKETVDKIKPEIEKYLGYELVNDNSSIEFTGASISSSFYKQLRFAVILSFILMAIVVFIIFRTPVRSLSVIIAGLSDIIMTIVVLNMLEFQLSTAGIVALLMLIGYSVDVDILLTSRVMRSTEGTFNERLFSSFKTGITMTLTAMAAVAVALIFTHSFSPILFQMFTIILIGLCFDIMNCWITNASILKWYVERKEKK